MSWLEPLAVLPLWAQAGILSAAVAGLFWVLPLLVRWLWQLGGTDE